MNLRPVTYELQKTIRELKAERDRFKQLVWELLPLAELGIPYAVISDIQGEAEDLIRRAEQAVQ